MDHDLLWKTTEGERLALAGLLESLSPEQWEAASLCRGWRVRDVAAHVTLSTRTRPLNAMVGLVRARGNFNRYVSTDALARSGRAPSELIADLRRAAPARHHPPGTRPEDPLVDVLVHTQDIAVALGIERAMPAEAAVVAADRVWAMSFPFRAQRRCRGVRLEATDADWERGSGEKASGPLASILLVLTGRRAGLDQLAGPGAGALASRFG